MSGSVHHATVTAVRRLAEGIYEYTLTLPPEDARLEWRPGQFVSIACGAGPDGEPILRSYSIASSPGSAAVLLVVRLIPGGVASAWFERLALGASVRFTGPMGFFVLDAAHPGDVVFGATGTGIAPVVPMLRALVARDEPGRIAVHWGMRSEDELFWHDELAALAHPRLAIHLHLSRPGPGWTGARGRITGPLLEDLGELSRPTFYLVGNGAMIKEVKAGLVERGVDRKRQIRTEAFFD